MECALFRGAVTEEAQDNITLVAYLCSPGRARGVRDAGAHDARRAEKAAFYISEMHGAAKSLAKPVHASVDLRHHGFGIAAEHQGIPVATVRGKSRVTLAEMTE